MGVWAGIGQPPDSGVTCRRREIADGGVGAGDERVPLRPGRAFPEVAAAR
ncbi:MAG: hypothetical protein ACLPVF_14840 [Acidimicrobiales bacterium]